MSGEGPALESLRRNLERTEQDLRNLGYVTERVSTPPGAQLSNQLFEEETLILLLLGHLHVTSNDVEPELLQGDRLHVPAGVPFTLTVMGDDAAYWIQAMRIPKPEPPGSGESSGRPTA